MATRWAAPQPPGDEPRRDPALDLEGRVGDPRSERALLGLALDVHVGRPTVGVRAVEAVTFGRGADVREPAGDHESTAEPLPPVITEPVLERWPLADVGDPRE